VPAGGETGSRRALLGELLVESNVISREQLAEVLAVPRQPGKKLGQVLIERGWITEAQLTQTLSLQLSVPWVSLYHIDFSRQLLNRVSREVAERYCLIPVFVRHVKGQGETLYVAMDDPTNEVALAEVARQAGLPAKPMISSATDIRSALRVYYGEPAPQTVVEVPMAANRAEPPTTLRDGPSRAGGPATPATPTEPEPVAASRAASQPPPPLPTRKPSQPPPRPPRTVALEPQEEALDPGPPTDRSAAPSGTTLEEEPKRRPDAAEQGRRRARMVNLTLLDGTTIQLPPRASRKATFASREGLTANDFVAALRASAQGADASEVLGESPQWEPVVAALLSILLRKGLIADWELVEELRKI
jgi:type IV pilus assembly protein PilB